MGKFSQPTQTLQIETLQQGKPLAEAMGEVAFAASFFQWFLEEARRNYGDVIPLPNTDRRGVTFRQPVGVAALITPVCTMNKHQIRPTKNLSVK